MNNGIWIVVYFYIIIVVIFACCHDLMTDNIPYYSVNTQDSKDYVTKVRDIDSTGSFVQYYVDSFGDSTGFVYRMDAYNLNNPSKKTAVRVMNYDWKLPNNWDYIDTVDGEEISIPVKYIHRESLAAKLIEKDAKYFLKAALAKNNKIP